MPRRRLFAGTLTRDVSDLYELEACGYQPDWGLRGMYGGSNLPDMSTSKKSRSGTSRTYEERLAGGRPNVTFSLPLAAVEALARLADHYKLSRSAVVALAITELEKRIR